VIGTARGTNRSIRFNSGVHSFDDWQLSTGEDGGAVPANGRLSAGRPRLVSVGKRACAAGRSVRWPTGPRGARFARRSRSVPCEHFAPVAFCDRASRGTSRGSWCSGEALEPLVERRRAGGAGSGLRTSRWRAACTAASRFGRGEPRAEFPIADRENRPAESATAERALRERSRRNGQPVIIRVARPRSFFATKGNE
jgi:hypothetical protein